MFSSSIVYSQNIFFDLFEFLNFGDSQIFESAQICHEFTAKMKADKPCLKAKSQNPNLTSMAFTLIF